MPLKTHSTLVINRPEQQQKQPRNCIQTQAGHTNRVTTINMHATPQNSVFARSLITVGSARATRFALPLNRTAKTVETA